MTDAKKDSNQVPVMLATSNADGTTPLPIRVNPTTHAIVNDDNTTGSDLSGDNAKRDNNGEPVMLGVSSADGLTPTPIYGNPSGGKLLVNSH